MTKYLQDRVLGKGKRWRMKDRGRQKEASVQAGKSAGRLAGRLSKHNSRNVVYPRTNDAQCSGLNE